MVKDIIIDEKETGYLVSDEGKVFNKKTGRELKGTKTDYQRVQFKLDGKPKTLLVHRLVATAFLNNPNGYEIVDHVNRDRFDNRAENLRWASYSENAENCEKRTSVKSYKAPTYDIAEYVPIKGHSNYGIAHDGEIIDFNKKEIKPISKRNGYHRVHLDGRLFTVHRLVYETFVGPIMGYIDHIDGNKDNNSVENLRDVNQSMNMKNAYRNGHKRQVGVTQFSSDKKEIITHYNSMQAAAHEVGVTEEAIRAGSTVGAKSKNFYWLRDNSITTKEQFCTTELIETEKTRLCEVSWCGDILFNNRAKQVIPLFKDEKGIYFYHKIVTDANKYYICLETHLIAG